MGLLSDVIKMQANLSFLDSDRDAEDVIYTPAGGSPISIKARITRNAADWTQNNESINNNYHLSKLIVVSIANDATRGVTSINTGGDTITMSKYIGDAPEAFQVSSIMANDAGMWKIGCK